MKERSVGLDLLRLLMMYAVVVQHCCLYPDWNTGDLTKFLFVLTVPAVDCFAGLSGWFGIRFSIWKLVRLLGQIFCCSATLSLLACICFVVGVEPRILISPGVGWFGVCYIALVLLSPFVGWILECCGKRKCVRIAVVFAWALWIVLWQFVPGRFLFFVPISGSHSLGTILLVYCTLRLFGKHGVLPVRPQCELAGGIAVLVVCLAVVVWQAISGILADVRMLDLVKHGYASTFVILLSASLVAIFSHVKTIGRLDALVTRVAPSLFSVYLLHSAHVFGQEYLMLRPMRHVVNLLSVSVGGQVLLCFSWAMIVMVVCILADLAGRCVLRNVWQYVQILRTGNGRKSERMR